MNNSFTIKGANKKCQKNKENLLMMVGLFG